MRLDLQDCELCLADNVPVRLSRACGLTVLCTAGRVWLTVDGEAGDIVLYPGQAHCIRSNGLALLEAIGRGQVRLQSAPVTNRYLFQPSVWQLRFPRWPTGKASATLCRLA